MTIRYNTPSGGDLRLLEFVPWNVRAKGPFPYEVGQLVTVMVDRRDPKVAAMDGLHGQAMVDQLCDRRAALSLSPPAMADVDGFGFDLFDEAPGRRAARKVGSLRLQGERLSVQTPDGSLELGLNEPFRLCLTAFIVSEEAVALNVEVWPQGALSRGRKIAFTVHLDQERVDIKVPLKQERLPVVDSENFEVVWSVLASRAMLHGDSAWKLVAPSSGSDVLMPQTKMGPAALRA